jgi:DNA-binding MarR family transcriptional regulator
MTETERLLVESPSYRAWWFLARAYHSLASQLDRFFDERGITGAQFGVLRCVADAEPQGLMLSELSRRLMVTGGNITGVADRLEQAGLIRRERDASDRRVVRALLTPKGRSLFRQVMPEYLDLVQRMLHGLSEEEAEAISRCCEKLHRDAPLTSGCQAQLALQGEEGGPQPDHGTFDCATGPAAES